MKRVGVALAAVLMAAGALSGCGGSAYCNAVEDNQSTLNDFGGSHTTAAFTGYAKAAETVAKAAPAGIKDDWAAIAAATRAVLKQSKASGLPLEDIPTQAEFSSSAKAAKAKVAAFDKLRDRLKLTDKDFAPTSPLNKSRLAFSEAIQKHAVKVVKNVNQECKIILT